MQRCRSRVHNFWFLFSNGNLAFVWRTSRHLPFRTPFGRLQTGKFVCCCHPREKRKWTEIEHFPFSLATRKRRKHTITKCEVYRFPTVFQEENPPHQSARKERTETGRNCPDKLIFVLTSFHWSKRKKGRMHLSSSPPVLFGLPWKVLESRSEVLAAGDTCLATKQHNAGTRTQVGPAESEETKFLRIRRIVN